MKKNIYSFVTIILLLSAIEISGRDFRVSQLPNGSKFSCGNCHTSSFGGGPRNKFGQEVEKLVGSGSQSFWGQAIALLDSDGDGKTNGQELGDPNGAWRPGSANPGVLSGVSNPGDPNSITSIKEVAGIPSEFLLMQNYPNPFNPETIINYQISSAGNVRLVVFDILGKELTLLVNEIQQPGYYSAKFSSAEAQLPTGIYFYRLETNKAVLTRKMMLVK
jgi:hypothetical protein